MNPVEVAAYIFGKSVWVFTEVVPIPEKAIMHFAMEAAKNEMGEWEMMRTKLYKSSDEAYYTHYWTIAKAELAKLPAIPGIIPDALSFYKQQSANQ
jgi:hypothetical protein